MQTIFLLSIHYARKKKYLASAFTYACLINFKHIYIYPALAYVIFLLKEYIVIQKGYQNKIHCMGKLAIVTLTPFFLSFAPFFIVGGIAEIGQIATRLFPFQRGLIHEYWAPNFWALYHFTDKVLTLLLPSFRLVPTTANQNSLRVLPEISASMTTLLILLVSVPLLYRYWQGSFGSSILIFLCGSIFFLIGYHCH